MIGREPSNDAIVGRRKSDFDALRRNADTIASDTTFEERIDFLTQIAAMTGHKRRRHTPITGDKFRL